MLNVLIDYVIIFLHHCRCRQFEILDTIGLEGIELLTRFLGFVSLRVFASLFSRSFIFVDTLLSGVLLGV